jgi:hypothetical protein
MIELDKIESAQFAAYLNEEFAIVTPTGTIPAKLAEVRNLRHANSPSGRVPFSLLFRAAPHVRLPQHIYLTKHPRFGEMEIFLVQVGADAEGATLEAIFN